MPLRGTAVIIIYKGEEEKMFSKSLKALTILIVLALLIAGLAGCKSSKDATSTPKPTQEQAEPPPTQEQVSTQPPPPTEKPKPPAETSIVIAMGAGFTTVFLLAGLLYLLGWIFFRRLAHPAD